MHIYPIVAIQWETEDGVRYDTKEKCHHHNKLNNSFKELMQPLGCLAFDDKLLEFRNGGGFIQHSPGIVKKILQDFIDLLTEAGILPSTTVTKTTGSGKDKKTTTNKKPILTIEDFQILGTYLGETGLPFKVWNRLICIDDNGREWGQPYFKQHPEKGVKKIWNKQKNNNKYW